MGSPMSRTIQLVENAGRRFEHAARRKTPDRAASSPRVITISRQRGSGGRRIAEMLEKGLGWPVWDREVLDVLASQSYLGYQARMFDALDERTQGEIETVVLRLSGQADKHVYFYLLPRAILTIAQADAIIVGRGAHLFLPRSLKIRVVASFHTRLHNLVHFEGLTEAEARERIKVSDRERDAFVHEVASRLRHHDEQGPAETAFDLVINTDHFSVREAASIALGAVAQRFKVEPSALPGTAGEVEQPEVAVR